MSAVPAPELAPCHAAAHTYAVRGWRVVPIKPGTKRPIPNRWQQLSTTNPDQIDRWWRDHPDAGVGIATGQGLCVIDIDDHDTDGWAAWANLCDQHGQDPVPDTVIACTGGGGHHLLYHVPAGTKISNGAATRLPAGIDVRGDGGQIVAPPTIHTTGAAYAWAEGHSPDETGVADMPQWLLDLLTGPTAPRTPRGAPTPTAAATTPRIDAQTPEDRPGDRWATATTWDALLHDAGAHIGPPDNQGRRPVTRPGKHPTEGTSATLWTTSDTLKVFTTNWPGLAAEETYTKFGFYAATRHQGDHSAAAAAINQANGWTPTHLDPASLVGATLTTAATPAAAGGETVDDEPRGPQPIDWDAFWSREAPEAEWLFTDIIPADRQTIIFAPAKAGKSLLTLEMVAAIASGRAAINHPAGEPVDVIYLDLEMSEDDLKERLEDLGYGPDDDLTHLHYYLLPSLPPMDTDLGGQTLMALVERHQPRLVVIDTMGRVVQGEENSSDTYRAFYRHTGSRLKRARVALARLDHEGKDSTKGQRGSSSKTEDVDLVWRLTADGRNIKLTRTHARIGWAPEEVLLTRHDDDGTLSHRPVLHQWAEHTRECAEDLDRIGWPVVGGGSQNAAMRALRAAGYGRDRAVVKDALAFRRTPEYLISRPRP